MELLSVNTLSVISLIAGGFISAVSFGRLAQKHGRNRQGHMVAGALCFIFAMRIAGALVKGYRLDPTAEIVVVFMLAGAGVGAIYFATKGFWERKR